MTVGDIVWKRPEFGAAKGQQSVPPQEARVVYITRSGGSIPSSSRSPAAA